jgi:NADH dehydrogenase
MADDRNIVIVGGGFAGTTLARRLERLPLAGHRVVLVSEESTTTFHPMLAEVVGAAVFPEHVVAPIRQMLRTSRFVMGPRRRGRLAAPRRRRLDARRRARDRLRARRVRVRSARRPRPRPRSGRACAAAEARRRCDLHPQPRPAARRPDRARVRSLVRRRLGHFVVVGGGFSGVEVAGQLADFLRGVPPLLPARRRRRAARDAPRRRRAAALRAAAFARPGRALRR